MNLDRKISIKGRLERFGIIQMARLKTVDILLVWHKCYGYKPISQWHKVKP